MPESYIALDEENDFTDHAAPIDTFTTKDTGAKISLARVDGMLIAFTAVGKNALATLSIAGTVVGPAFVILDFVDHKWVGGAIGAVGLAASIAAGFALSGPVGWVVGGAIAAFFASKSAPIHHLFANDVKSSSCRALSLAHTCCIHNVSRRRL